MCRYVRDTGAQEIIVGTEIGIIHRLKKENPEKLFYPASEQAICPNMKLITLEKVLWALEDMKPKIDVPLEITSKARRCIERMLEYS
jgi:quinolinate synthase